MLLGPEEYQENVKEAKVLGTSLEWMRTKESGKMRTKYGLTNY